MISSPVVLLYVYITFLSNEPVESALAVISSQAISITPCIDVDVRHMITTITVQKIFLNAFFIYYTSSLYILT